MSDDSINTPFAPIVELDRDSDVPLYEQIAKPIADLITSEALKPGQLIEDEVSLARRLDVSRPTARRALQDLASAGLLSRRRGAGTRVAPAHVQRQLSLTSLNADLQKSGHSTTTKVLSYEVFFADDPLAEKLQIAPGTELVSVRRLRNMDGVPLALMHNVIPSEYAPSLTELSSKSLYSCFDARGIVMHSALQTIGARNASKDEASLLDIEANAAVVTMERITFDADHHVIEYGDHVYNARQYHITIPLLAQNS
ncbi:MAG: GntR family transcriptional regulator [Actinomycetaceae bacterium]|nr:GntR family transcriptional regulator [Actinomycetaceae bacterium]